MLSRHDVEERVEKNESSSEEEKAVDKKVLKTLSELSHKIDEASSKCAKVSELFSPLLVNLRRKVREVTVNLVLKQATFRPVVWTCLDVDWRKSTYEVISVARRIKEKQEKKEIYLKYHLVNSIGHFHHLLLHLDRSDFAAMNLHYGWDSKQEKKSKKWPDNQLLSKVVHRCLLCLGDLSRYQLEYVTNDDQQKKVLLDVTRRYYHQALAVNPSNGLPYNQLAALAGNQRHGLVAVCYYLRCLNTKNQFEGSEGNLKKLLEKNSLTFAKLNQDSSSERTMVVCLLQLINELLYEDSTKKLAQRCQTALVSVQNCLYAQQDRTISSQVATYCVIVLLFSMQKMAKKETKLQMIRAYLMALFTNFVTKLLADLQFTLFGPDAMMEVFIDPTIEEQEVENDKQTTVVENGSKVKKKLSRIEELRRRRKRNESDSDEEDLSANDSDSDDSNEDSEGEPSDDENGILTDSYDEDDDDEEVVVESSDDVISSLTMVKLVANHSLTEAIRLCTLWLMSSRDVVEESGENSQILWQRLAKLFNTVSLTNPKFEPSKEVDDATVKKCQELLALKPFPEDLQTRGLVVFAQHQQQLNWEHEHVLTRIETGVSRILQLKQFAQWLSSVAKTGITLDTQDVVTWTRHVENGIEQDEEVAEEEVVVDDTADQSERKLMMQNMAQLWLQQEVKDLEGRESGYSSSTNGFAQYSPYLVVDHFALIKHLHLVKDIVSAKRFAIIVPSAVVQELDGVKKEDGRARNAIRWLERQFEEGSRWLRGQKPHEAKTMDMITYPKKKNKQSWHYFQILECCNYFSAVRGKSSKMSVTLLTSDSTQDDEKENQEAAAFVPPFGVAKSLDVRVENIDEFLAKCQIKKGTNNNPRRRGYGKQQRGATKNGDKAGNNENG